MTKNSWDRWSHADTPSAEQNASIQRGIDSAMADVLRTRNYNPQNPWPSTSEPEKKPGSGWQEPEPLAPHPSVRLIDALVNSALPHGPKSKAD
jgi:hypothetical protein